MEVRQTNNLLLGGGLIASQLAALLVCAAAPEASAAAMGSLGLCLLFTNPYWSLLHEAIHGIADGNPRRNEAVGRIMGILYGSPFALLRIGHLLHHRFNRIAEISEGYDPAKTPRPVAWLRHYGTILGGLYWAEIAGGFVLLLPQRWWRPLLGAFGADERFGSAALNLLGKPETRRAARCDVLLIIALYGTVVLAGHWKMLLAALFVRSFLISFFDNAYHYGTAVGNRRAARNLALPTVLSRFILNFNLHGVHHIEPWVPWFELPQRAAVVGARCSGGLFGAAASQLRGPIPFDRLPRTTRTDV